MYLEKINITEFRVLKDIEICFKTPVPEHTESAETGNVINVLAGVNGCGKTSLLDVIFESFKDQFNSPLRSKVLITLSELGCINVNNYLSTLLQKIQQLNQENTGKLPLMTHRELFIYPLNKVFHIGLFHN
jgi:recombinational DNA repair ATPase RecF